MEKIFIHILSTFDSVFKFSKGNKTLLKVSSTESLSDTIDLEISNPESFQISVYPTGKKNKQLFSYSTNFAISQNNILSENDYVKVYKLPENHFIIKFFPFFIEKEGIYGDRVELVGFEIKKLSFLNDLAGRAKVDIFNLNENKISPNNEYFVYTNENNELETHPDLILLAFFEAYKATDFNVCFSYLSESYGQNLNKEGLIDFFGKFNDCLLVNYYTYPSVILLYNNHALVFSSSIQYNKISDIYEL